LHAVLCLDLLAEVAAALGQWERAARLLGAAAAPRDAIEPHVGVIWRPGHVPARVAARAHLGERAFAAAWDAGRALSLEEAVAEARLVGRDAPEAACRPAGDRAVGAGLTRREREVLRLLVEGRSDREIAEALGLSYRTVTSYVRNILDRLDVDSRTAAATRAVRHDLV
jgi:DNA-binding CsgD family transcriptional regulator